jgi:hypothetical protein
VASEKSVFSQVAVILGWLIDLSKTSGAVMRPKDEAIDKLCYLFFSSFDALKPQPLVVWQSLQSLTERYSMGLRGMRGYFFFKSVSLSLKLLSVSQRKFNSLPSTFQSTVTQLRVAVSSKTTRHESFLVVPQSVPTTKNAVTTTSFPLLPHSSASSSSFLGNSISAAMKTRTRSSRISYSAGWHRWLKFIDSLFSFQVTCVAGFLCYLVNDVSSPVQPREVDISFMDESMVIQKTRTGLMNLWRSKEGNSLADKKALPVSIDMVFSMKLPNCVLS